MLKESIISYDKINNNKTEDMEIQNDDKEITQMETKLSFNYDRKQSEVLSSNLINLPREEKSLPNVSTASKITNEVSTLRKRPERIFKIKKNTLRINVFKFYKCVLFKFYFF